MPNRPTFKEADSIDRRILKLLQENARLSMTELAERVGAAATTGATPPRLNPARLGYGLLVFVEIKLHSKSGDIFEEFRREVLKIPQILECHLVSGEYDYLIKVRLQDMSAYRDMLGKILLQLPSAVESRSYVVMEEVKENGPLALEDWED